MEKKKIWYSITNGGDGSASITLMESEELAEFDQEHLYEGWGEPCYGSIEYSGEIHNNITSKEKYLIDNYILGYSNNKDEAKLFINQFFPEGIPTNFKVITDDNIISGKYKYNNILVNDKVVVKNSFTTIEKAGDILEKILNTFTL